MDYNSFFTRDYKSLLEPAPRRRRRWTSLHTLLLASAMATLTTVLVFISADAEATRPTTAAAAKDDRPQRITITLAFPALENESAVVPAPPTRNPAADEGSGALDAAASPPATSDSQWRRVNVRRGDSLARIFRREGLDPADLHRIVQLGPLTRALRHLQPGQAFRFRVDEQGRLVAMEYVMSRLESLVVTRQDSGFTARQVQHPLEARLAYAAGEIESSLFEAGKSAGLSDALIMELVGIFGWDIDFAMDIRQGDRFSLLYEEQYLQGEKIRNGPIVAAEFTTRGRTFRAVRYTDARGHSDYYTPDGHSMRKAFLRTPVDFRRISSRFGRRHHPVLNRMKMHKGVDYAARRGTPIKAAGDGRIVFRGHKGGYGRVIIIQHGGRYSTLYAHMSAFKKGLRVGSRVRQGQIIGFVGSSGRATGPHLHYEFRVDGVHRNPLTVKLPDAAPLRQTYLEDFRQKTAGLLSQLDLYNRTRLALRQP